MVVKYSSTDDVSHVHQPRHDVMLTKQRKPKSYKPLESLLVGQTPHPTLQPVRVHGHQRCAYRPPEVLPAECKLSIYY